MALRSSPAHISESTRSYKTPDCAAITHASAPSESRSQSKQSSHELLVVRHAKSAWGPGAKRDFDRPLAARGKRDAPRMGRWLDIQGLLPDYVVSSPAKRTKQTTEMMRAKLGFDKVKVVWEPKLYNASLVEILEVLAACPKSADRVMLVGHHTGLRPLLKFLYGPSLADPSDVKLFPTGAVAHMKIPVDWHRLYTGVAHDFRIIRPRSLPYGPESCDRRSRKRHRKANRKTEKQVA